MERMARKEVCWFTGEFLGFLLYLVGFIYSTLSALWLRNKRDTPFSCHQCLGRSSQDIVPTLKFVQGPIWI